MIDFQNVSFSYGEESSGGGIIAVFKIKAHIRRSGTSRNNQR